MRDILWCPIDLPKCPVIPEFSVTKQWAFWQFLRLTNNVGDPYGRTDWSSEVKTKYPELIEWFSMFPIKSVRNVKMNKQVCAVDAHIDFTRPDAAPDLWKNNSDNEPCGYRVLLSGTRKNKLYVVDGDKRIYCDMPEDTDVYVLGHTSTLHGVENDENRFTLFTHFEIDPDKHKALLDRSLKKYGSRAIYKT